MVVTLKFSYLNLDVALIRFPEGKTFDMASGTIETIKFSTKKAHELVGKRFLTSGWGHTENSPQGGDFESDLRIVEMEFMRRTGGNVIVNGHPTDPERILVADHRTLFNVVNGELSIGHGDSGGNEMKIK